MRIGLAALSARALAASARRAGLEPIVFDLFADADTTALAMRAVRVGGSVDAGIDWQGFERALEVHLPPGAPLVLGAGFEERPGRLRDLTARYALTGNDADAVTLLTDPFAFSALLARLGIRHPKVFRHAPLAGGPLLSKRIGGSGGGHVSATPSGATWEGFYLQERLVGTSVSALFLADGHEHRLLGLSEQWTSPSPGKLFRYGGAVGPVTVDTGVAKEIASTLAALVPAARVVGLNSADFILSASGPALLEVNPRPGATLDLFDREPMPPLIRLHLDACRGRLPARLPAMPRARAAAVLYADASFRAPAAPWPDWVADRPRGRSCIEAGQPICTVLADGLDPPSARDLVERRSEILRRRLSLQGEQSGEAA